MSGATAVRGARAPATLPRLGFLGVGWIGRHRMEAIARSGAAEVAAIADPGAEALAEAARLVPDAERADSLDALLAQELDGLVIATPSALHAEQSIAALQRGVAVFCQKPLARTADEARRVVRAAREAGALLGVDLSYRHTEAVRRIRALLAEGALGRIYAAELVFHNAYGPGKDWFFDVERSGGGCVIDLGIHLVDLALWLLDVREVPAVSSRLYHHGRLLAADPGEVEDFAVARLDLADGATVSLSCSWHAHAGRDAVIELVLYGTEGGVAMRNVNGSFYDFAAQRFRGTAAEPLCEPPDDWGGRAAVSWARRLAAGEGYDPAIEDAVRVAETLDRIYGRGRR